MSEIVEKIKSAILQHCSQNDKTIPRKTTDSASNASLEWETSLILEFREKHKKNHTEKNFSQSIPVQFDVSFDELNHKIYVFLQWGRIDKKLWKQAEKSIVKEINDRGDVSVRFTEENEVVELGIIYPFQEFDFPFVYQEIVSFFGLLNGILFHKANE